MGGLRSARLSGGALVAAGQWLGCALYLLILVVANVPAITLFGTRIPSLLGAGLSLSLLVTLGVLLAWGYFLTSAFPTARPVDATRGMARPSMAGARDTRDKSLGPLKAPAPRPFKAGRDPAPG